MYDVIFHTDRAYKAAIPDGQGISAVKDGFWLTDTGEITNKSNGTTWIAPARIVQIVKQPPQ